MGCDLDTASEEWRLLCEARHVISMPNIGTRRAYLDLIGKRRGLEAKLMLETAIREEWTKMREKK